MKKKINIVFIFTCIMSILLFASGCGSNSGNENSPYAGKWIAVSAQMAGISVGVEETIGGSIELEVKNDGKVDVFIGEDKGNGSWEVKDKQFTLTIEGEDMVGEIGDNIISFDNMLGTGAKMIFAKEGTDAMDTELYLTEEEQAVLGEWMSESVEELLGDGPMTTMEGVSDIHDALRLNFKNDRNVDVSYKGEKVGTFPWSVALGYCLIETENPSLTVKINEDKTLDVDYSTDEDYYMFHCVKNSSETK